MNPEELSPWERDQVYNGLDVCVTRDCLDAMLPQLDEHTEKTYEFSKALQGPTLEMRVRGVLVDQARKAEGFVDFVHLHNHTHYSLLVGLQKVPELIDHIESLGQNACAITDHGSLSGAIEFYKACIPRGIKPIIGIETYVAPRTHTDKNSNEDRNPFHLILLASTGSGTLARFHTSYPKLQGM